MLNLEIMFHDEPESVLIEDLPEGMSRVMLRANVIQKASPGEIMGEGEEPVTNLSWYADEAYMECDTGSRPTKEEIEADFDTWYNYIGSWENMVTTDTIKTLRTAINNNQDQINMLTECILEMSAQVYAEA